MKAPSYLRTPRVWRCKMHILLHRAGLCLVGLLVVVLFNQSVLAADAGATPPLHTFTEAGSGRQVQANILRFADPNVYLVHPTGTYHVYISDFVAADQAYIRQWAKTQAAADQLAASALEVSASPNRLVGEARQGGPQSFALSLKNVSNQPLTGLTVSYILFRLPGTDGKISQFPLPRLTGESSIKTVTPNGTLVFDSIPLTNGNAPLAIWVRIYSSDGAIVQDIAPCPISCNSRVGTKAT